MMSKVVQMREFDLEIMRDCIVLEKEINYPETTTIWFYLDDVIELKKVLDRFIEDYD